MIFGRCRHRQIPSYPRTCRRGTVATRARRGPSGPGASVNTFCVWVPALACTSHRSNTAAWWGGSWGAGSVYAYAGWLSVLTRAGRMGGWGGTTADMCRARRISIIGPQVGPGGGEVLGLPEFAHTHTHTRAHTHAQSRNHTHTHTILAMNPHLPSSLPVPEKTLTCAR